MFEVRFIMNDGSTDQEYFYHQFKDAEYHFHLFDDDDSGLYFSIEIQNGDTTVVRRIIGFEEEELSLIFTADKADLTDLCIYLESPPQSHTPRKHLAFRPESGIINAQPRTES